MRERSGHVVKKTKMADSKQKMGGALAMLVAFAVYGGAAFAQDKPAGEAKPAPQGTAAPDATAAPGTPGPAAAPDADGKSDAKKRPLSPKQKDRVFIKDLEGTWIATDYVERLKKSRSPNVSGRKGGVAIKIQREGPVYPILFTNFQRAVLQSVIDVQPDRKPKSYRLAVAKEDRGAVNAADLSYVYFRGEREANGAFKTLSISEPIFAKNKFLAYQRLDVPLEQFVNATVISGKYADAQGNTYEFSDSGDAVLPDVKFGYEVSLDAKAASNCDLLESHRERDPQGKQRIGFAWKGDKLELFKVTGTKAPYKCEAQPYAVLTRQ